MNLIKSFKNFMSRRTFSAKVRNRFMNKYSSYDYFIANRVEAEKNRLIENRSQEVLYFHKVDDPYSHLTINCVDKFISNYDVSIKPILVGLENPETVHEPTLYDKYCLDDVKRIAPFYNINFPGTSIPSDELITKANSILTAVDADNFIKIAQRVSFALWTSDELALDNLLKTLNATKDEVVKKLNEGNAIRNSKGYYFGSAFYYENECYWGVDRLPYLEQRLSELNLKTKESDDPVCPLKINAPEQLSSTNKINLTYYPSLNSPYTFVSSKRVKQLRDHYPINLITKPVLPMLMRGMTIPTHKGVYIVSDAAREGRLHNHEIKSIYSPIGKPARAAFSLFPSIDALGQGFEYIDELLKASFQEGINIGDKDYLKDLVISLGIDWNIVSKDLNSSNWKKDLNNNLSDMYSGNCWGVPSFKLTNEDGSNPYYVWGQDRIWLIKEEINRRIKKGTQSPL